MKNSKRIYTIDLARTFAILCVLLTHATESVYDFSSDFLCTAPNRVTVLGVLLHTIGRLGVPVFVMLTGYLMLDREYDQERTIFFYKNSFFRLLLVTVIWIVIYYFYSNWWNQSSFDLQKLIEQILFFRTPSANHIWYMGTILGVYLVIPFLATILKNINKKVLLFVIGFSCIYFFVPPTINVFRRVEDGISLQSQFNLGFSGGWYGILAIVGWMIKKGYFDQLKTWCYLPLAFVFLILTTALQVYSIRNGIVFTVWYDSILLNLSSVFFLLFLLQIKKSRCNKIVMWIGYSSFAVYLIHMTIMPSVAKVLNEHGLLVSHLQKTLAIFLATFFLCEFVVFLLSRSKKISKILFGMK